MVLMVAAIGAIGAYFINKTRTKARVQIQNIVAEYMPLDVGNDSPSLDPTDDVGGRNDAVELS